VVHNFITSLWRILDHDYYLYLSYRKIRGKLYPQQDKGLQLLSFVYWKRKEWKLSHKSHNFAIFPISHPDSWISRCINPVLIQPIKQVRICVLFSFIWNVQYLRQISHSSLCKEHFKYIYIVNLIISVQKNYEKVWTNLRVSTKW
jgi:hypothetical protein